MCEHEDIFKPKKVEIFHCLHIVFSIVVKIDLQKWWESPANWLSI